MATKTRRTKVTIIGAGPAGLSASLFLSKFKIDHCLIDKEVFPRDKICGDALSGKVTSILRDIDVSLARELEQLSSQFEPSWGVIFSAPDGNEVAIPFKHKPEEGSPSPGFISKRKDFDAYLLDAASKSSYCSLLQGHEIQRIEKDKTEVRAFTDKECIISDLALGADGNSNIAGKQFLNYSLDKNHFCAGLRQYYEGVKELNSEGYIELHFVEEALPGYFWIFPLPNGMANVGIGMLSKYISKDKVNLKELLAKVIESDKFRDRFAGAKALEKPKGWGLPLGSKKRPLSTDRIMVIGDAASLIDPFTGEGIGNAMISGRIAARVCEEALEKKEYSAKLLAKYDKAVYNKLWGELRLSRILQKLIRYPWLFNWMIGKIRSNSELRKTITFMFEDVNLRKKFMNPAFYFRLLFSK